jgi:hypothetical protein
MADMSERLDRIRKERLSEVDEILDLFQGKLGLDDILNQDYSLITDLASVRDEKNAERIAQQKKMIPTKKETLSEKVVGAGNKNNVTKSSVSKTKKRSV